MESKGVMQGLWGLGLMCCFGWGWGLCPPLCGSAPHHDRELRSMVTDVCSWAFRLCWEPGESQKLCLELILQWKVCGLLCFSWRASSANSRGL